MACVSFSATKLVVPHVKQFTLKANLFGKDINKRGTPAGTNKIPESLGNTTAALIYICHLVFSQGFYYTDAKKLLDLNAACLCITFMVLLGFADDVMDVPRRYKTILPFIAALPVLAAYSGGTDVRLPR
eukprot:UN00710